MIRRSRREEEAMTHEDNSLMIRERRGWLNTEDSFVLQVVTSRVWYRMKSLSTGAQTG